MSNNRIRETNGLRTWIEIDRKKVANNYKIIRFQIPRNCKLMAVVKSNAYGHGLVEFSREIERLGADWLGVDSIVEAVALRKGGSRKSILVLGYTLPEMIETAAAFDTSLTVSTFEILKAVCAYKSKERRISIHLKIDTGMHRQGFFVRDIPEVLKILRGKKNVILDGVYTHFAAAKNPAFPQNTEAQISEFQKARTLIRRAGFTPLYHASASSAVFLFPKYSFDIVRSGISLYGLWPSREVEFYNSSKFKLEPVLSWRTIIGEIKKVKKGERVGYDFTEVLKSDTTIAVCPIGYWHGYPRSLSSIGYILVKNKKAKVLGRVSMDMTAIDVTDAPSVKVGDVATIIGRNGRSQITVDEISLAADISPYEFITRINPLIKRIYI